MIKLLYKYRSIFVLFLVILISPITKRIIETPILTTFLLLGLWILIFKFEFKYIWIFLITLILLNLYINRLLSFSFNPLIVSFDIEQSFLGYSPIDNSILRYRQEGLWLTYSLRSLFYGNYLILVSWLSNVLKILSLSSWIRVLNFNGTMLLLFGVINLFKNKINLYKILLGVFLIIFSSSLRILGDTVTYVYVLYPILIYLLFLGAKNIYFVKYYYFWFFLFLVDLMLL